MHFFCLFAQLVKCRVCCLLSSLCPSLMIFQFLLIMNWTGASNSCHLRRVCSPVLSVSLRARPTQHSSKCPLTIYVTLSLGACCVIPSCTLSLAPALGIGSARPGTRTDTGRHRPMFESTGRKIVLCACLCPSVILKL